MTAIRLPAVALTGFALLAACGQSEPNAPRPTGKEVECMARAMYFESNRSSRDGMIAVGTVVMNRVNSDDFPNTICGVVGQKNQFAPGVMTKPMRDSGAPLAMTSAQAVVSGERHPLITKARFFHAAWYHAAYNNIHYVVTAGGNAFYEKRKPANVTRPSPLPPTEGITG